MATPAPHRTRPTAAFTLLELLIAISLIALLIGILLPVLSTARRAAKRVTCASNVRQIGLATAVYLEDYRQYYYWKGHPDNPTPFTNDPRNGGGMDWYVYGGRSTGNHYDGSGDGEHQGNFFNAMDPRPLNSYMAGDTEGFRCPHDDGNFEWSNGMPHYEWVGNSYTFNSIGHPLDTANSEGLAGVRSDYIRQPSRTPVYFDTSLHKAPGTWHGEHGNMAFADGHVGFTDLGDTVADSSFLWTLQQ